jgi:MSHA biogenesis protein MshK
MARRLTALLAAALVAGGSAAAAPFADPTRPPMLEGEKGEAGAQGAPRLESILIAPDRRVAVISGQQVTIGSRIAGGEVVGITESEVRIRKPGGEEALKLLTTQARRPQAPGKGK